MRQEGAASAKEGRTGLEGAGIKTAVNRKAAGHQGEHALMKLGP